MSTDERIRMLEAKIDALLVRAITQNTDTFQAVNAVSPRGVDDRLAIALDMLANEGKAQIARGAVKKRRKASAYSRRFGKEYKKLKQKHPRTKHATLMKRAHAAARKGGKKK